MGSMAVLQQVADPAAKATSSLDVLRQVAANDGNLDAARDSIAANPPGMPKPAVMQPSNLATAITNSPSSADPENPANPTPEGLAQMNPEDREKAHSAMLATAIGTIPALPAAAAGSERVLAMGEKAMEVFTENYPNLAKLAGKLGYGAGAAAAYELFRKITK